MAAAHPSMYAYDKLERSPHRAGLAAQFSGSSRRGCFTAIVTRRLRSFRQWLEKRYGSLDALNEAWVRHYSDWAEVDPPRANVGTYLDWIDWRNFIIERTTWQMRYRVSTIKETDTHHLPESHCVIAASH